MPLDEESEAILKARRLAHIPGVASLSVAGVRASRAAWQAGVGAATIDVHTVADLAVPGGNGPIRVRVYHPNAGKGLPVVAYFHGGGWVLGDLDHSDVVCRWLCREAGAIVVNVDYRLAPEHKYPAAAEDAYAVARWLSDHALTLGGDPSRLAVAGASAGGNLAAVAALMARDRSGPRLRAQLLVYPVTDAACDSPSSEEFAEGFILSNEDMRWYWRQYLTHAREADDAYACPLRAADLSGLPETLVITAECDPVRDDGERYAARLSAAGVPVTLSRYPGTLHGFFTMPGTNTKATAAVREAAGFLRRSVAIDGPA